MRWLGRILAWLDRHFEPFVMIIAYAGFTSIIAIEVVRRFAFHQQTTWGSEVSIHLFIWLTWFGTAWGIRNRTHLSFPGVRANMSRSSQFCLYLLDNFLWLALGVVVLYGAQKVLEVQYRFGSVIQGSGIPMWWSYSLIPIAWALIYVRVLQDTVRLVRAYRSGATLGPAEIRLRSEDSEPGERPGMNEARGPDGAERRAKIATG
jgi:TRAP-type C4-dicarboxylate transport system permease small subunit